MSEFVEDGIVCEAIYNHSYTLEAMSSSTEQHCYFITLLTKMTKSAIVATRKASALGLTDASILTRFTDKQRSFADAIERFARENYPTIAKRLYKREVLWDYLISASLCETDDCFAKLHDEPTHNVFG